MECAAPGRRQPIGPWYSPGVLQKMITLHIYSFIHFCVFRVVFCVFRVVFCVFRVVFRVFAVDFCVFAVVFCVFRVVF